MQAGVLGWLKVKNEYFNLVVTSGSSKFNSNVCLGGNHDSRKWYSDV